MTEREVGDYLQRQIGLTEAQWEQQKQFCHWAARSARQYYEALVEQGFSLTEALRIILAHGCAPKWPWTGAQDSKSDE